MIKTKPTDYIRTVQDYPVPGVNFYDINSLFAHPIWQHYSELLATQIQTTDNQPTHIVGIESRGFVVGAVLATIIGVPFVMVRKKGSKYPGSLFEESYGTEYSKDTLVLQKDVLGSSDQILIVDDLIATGGSMLATKRLVEQAQAKVVGFASIINLSYLNTDHIKKESVITLEEIK